jgi:hypothetical protein
VEKCLGGEPLAQRLRRRAILACELLDEEAIVLRIDDDRHPVMVLRRRAHHGRSADVDILDGKGVGCIRARADGAEGIEVDHHEVNRRDAMLGHDRVVDAAPS